MSTDINTQTPPPPQSEGIQGAPKGSGVSVVGFQSGNAANTMAVLTLIADLMKLSEFKNDLFTTQAQAVSNVADDYSQSQIDLGNQQMTELAIQGAFSMGMGLVTAGLGLAGMSEESNVTDLEGEVNGTQKFANSLENSSDNSIEDQEASSPARRSSADSEENGIEMDLIADHSEVDESEVQAKKEKMEERLDKMIKEIKSGEYRTSDGKGNAAPLKGAGENDEDFSDEDVVTTLSEDQLGELKDAVNERLQSLQGKLTEAKQDLRTNFDKRQMASTANQGVMQGAGNIGAGIMKQQEGEQQADNTQYDAAQKQFQNLTQETEKQADQDVQTADSLIQLIPDLDKSNGANLTA